MLALPQKHWVLICHSVIKEISVDCVAGLHRRGVTLLVQGSYVVRLRRAVHAHAGTQVLTAKVLNEVHLNEVHGGVRERVHNASRTESDFLVLTTRGAP